MRTFNRIASLALGLALIAGGLLIVVESMLAAYRRGPWLLPSKQWYESLRSAQLADPSTVIVALAVGLVGLALLFAELRPWPPRRLPVRPEPPAETVESTGTAEWWLLRRPTERRLARAVTDVPGVNAAQVRLRGRDRWRVDVLAQAREESRTGIEEAINAELARLSATVPESVRLRLREPKRVI